MTHPLVYEINTRCWLRDLSIRHGRRLTLDTVPETEFSEWQRRGFTHLWLMGVWTTGPRARELARSDPALIAAYDALLPGWRAPDIGGSPYSIAAYTVPDALGGEAGLQSFRQRLHAHGLRLLLDFVPNHLGVDHPWTREQPDRFVQSPGPAAGAFRVTTPAGDRWLAHGKDPYFAPWTDTAQLDYRRAETRAALTALLQTIAARCDGVRCDMAMLLLQEVFARTWAEFSCPDAASPGEFWAEAIPAVKKQHPDFLFLAEAYWGRERQLQLLGFDYTYDKQLYDELLRGHGAEVQEHLLQSAPEYVAASAHFLENHDEPRVAGALALAPHRAAALTVLGLPGLRLLHEGQLTGTQYRAPVQLTRRPAEPPVPEVVALYDQLLAALARGGVGRGPAQLIAPRAAWPANPTHRHFILVLWPGAPDTFTLVTVNLAPHPGQCYAALPVADLARRHWILRDLLSAEWHHRTGAELQTRGLYLDLPAYGAQIFQAEPGD